MRTPRARLARIAPVFLAVGALIFAGCSSSGSGGTPAAPAAPTSAAPAATDTTAADPAPDAGTEADGFPAGSTMARLSEAGKMTVGTKFDQPLFGLMGLDGVPEGFDVEIAKIIAGELGIDAANISWVETVSANREPFIENGTVDIVVATYTINDARKEKVSFAGPYYVAGQDILVLAGNPEGITGLADLEGKAVCSVTGSTPAQNLKDNGVNVIETDTYSNCLGPLRSGEVIAVSTDNVILAGLADQNAGEFEVIGSTFTVENYGIGLAHDDAEFRAFINDVLDAAYADGRWAAAWEATAGKVLDTPTPPAVDRY